MYRRFLDRMLARENTIASYVFVLTASAVLALLGSPVEISVGRTLLAISSAFASYVLFLHVYCHLYAVHTTWALVRPAHLLVLATPIAAVGVLLLAKGDVWFGEDAVLAKSYSTAVGDYEMLVLSDDSVVELNTDTTIRTRYSSHIRQIVLERGEARFSAAYDANRPFEVISETVTATALGTEFSVRRHEDGPIAVMVEKGRVRLTAWLTARTADSQPTGAMLDAGAVALIRGGEILTQQLSAAEFACRSSWTKGRLCFIRETLAEAAAEFNRYNHAKIVINDSRAGLMPVRGTFEATDPHSFVAAIEKSASSRSSTAPRVLVLLDGRK